MGEPDKRVRDVHELPDEPVRCAAAGRHVGFFNDPTIKEVDGWVR